jgi:PAS domain S-box-containing protein
MHRLEYRSRGHGRRKWKAAAASYIDVTCGETQRRRFAAQLPELASVLYDSDDAIIALDAGWHLTAWNLGAERMYGWTAGEVLGRHVTEIARLDLSDDERAAIRRAAEELGSWRGEVMTYRKDGNALHVDVNTEVMRDAQGRPAGFVNVHRDVTERRRAEQAVRELNRQMEDVLESMSESFVAVDREWRFTYLNERALERLWWRTDRDVTRDDVIGTDMWSWAPDASGTETHRRLLEAMAERRAVAFETYFAPSGEWLETSAYPIENGLTIFYRSIDDRKRAQAESERLAGRQAAVAQLGLRAIASDDLQSLLDDAVGATARMLEVDVVSIAEILHGRDELLLRAGVGWEEGAIGSATSPAGRGSLVGYTIMAGEPVVSLDMAADERFALSPLLRGRHAVSGVSVLIAGPERPFGALGAFSTERRVFHADDVSFLQAVANTISAAVDRAATQRRLIEVREAERRRIARDLHDDALQTLAVAQMQAGAAVAEWDAAERLAALRPALARVADQLRGAIYDLRLGASSNTSFTELLTELVAVQRAMAADCAIELDIEEGLPTRPLGPPGTEALRILSEALNNARRHARARTIRVRARVSAGRLVAEVSDDGRGFDPGRAHTAGHGAGLNGMHERSALLDARLEIRAAPGRGTHVLLDVPLLEKADRFLTAPVRVMVVEDQASIRDSIAWTLGREPDFEVVAQAASVAEARGLLKDVDVAVIDLGLPDGFGADIAEELRRVNPRAQSLVLTASIDPDEIARAYARGAATVLNKVAQLDQLVGAVRRLGPRSPL